MTERPILLVDDAQEIRTALRRMLVRAGYQVLEASNGDEALRIVGATAVAAVLLDLRMPGKSGEQVLQELRVVVPEVPVIMVSGALDAETRVHLLHLGANACVDKPVDEAKLMAALSAVLGP